MIDFISFEDYRSMEAANCVIKIKAQKKVDKKP